MAIYNLGSINWDRIYQLDHFPAAGETISSLGVQVGLGGKGLNQSVAVVRAGGELIHCGAVGARDTAMLDALAGIGLNTSSLDKIQDAQTGTALILLDKTGENSIILEAGANRNISEEHIISVLNKATASDWLLVQNETNNVAFAIAHAHEKGMRIALAAAPFDAQVVLPLIDKIDLLAVNEIEYQQIMDARNGDPLPPRIMLFLTKGAAGIEVRANGEIASIPAPKVEVVDTTGAGDTALGSFLARLDLGETIQTSLEYAVAASALQVKRAGAVGAIPEYIAVQQFIKGH